MRTIRYIAAILAGSAMIALPLAAFAATPSLSIGSVSPGTSVFANSLFSLTITTSGFSDLPSYVVTDSFAASSVTGADLTPGGQFSWEPQASDAGTHTLTLRGSDSDGENATITETVTVLPPPSLSISSVSSGTTVAPGTPFTFSVSAPGFTNPTFVVGDSFSPSTVADTDINSSGNFSWTPDSSQDGSHTITIYAVDPQGHNAQVNETVQVGSGPTLIVAGLSPGTSLSTGQTLSFAASALGFLPTSFSVADSFPGSSLSSTDISATGQFSWTPNGSDAGTHVLTVFGQVGAYGQNATTSVTITVLGPGGVAPTPTTALSSSAPTSALGSLESQLSTLESEIGTQSVSASASAGSTVTFSANISEGSSGAEVTQLQAVLASLGYFSGTPTGYYGAETAAAVKAFQAAHGLSRVGSVGPQTRAALNSFSSATTSSTSSGQSTTTSTTSPSSYDSSAYVFQNSIGAGDSDTDVIELQIRLASLGLLAQWPTGYYGAATEAAVEKFQTMHGIEATGSVGPATRAALNQE